MCLYGYTVADFELVHRFAKRDYRSGILMAGNMDTVGGLAGEGFVYQCDIRAAYGAGFDPNQHILRAGLWNGYPFHFQMIGAHQDQSPHAVRQLHPVLLKMPY